MKSLGNARLTLMFLMIAGATACAVVKARLVRADADAKSAATAGPHATAPLVLAASLLRLHQEALAHFHADPKNGFSRLPFVYEKIVKEWKTPEFSSGDLDGDAAIPFRKDMERIHEGALKEFLSLKLPPASKSKEPTPTFWLNGKFDPKKRVYEAKSVDLVGLLKNPEPVVYVSTKIGDADHKDVAPTRELDEFEAAGLEALRMGENLFGRTKEGVIRLVGSVRAEKSCVRCHRDKKEGDLLGAFSYVLREADYARVAPFRKKAEPIK